MSRQGSGGRVKQPVVPEVGVEIWKELLQAADAFNRLAPWVWMHDSQVIGLRHPATGEELLCSILGRLKSVFALVIYRNDAGRRWILNAILNEEEFVEDDQAAFEQDAIKAEFVLKRDLVKEDRAVLTAAGYKPAGKGARRWPHFRSMVPGCYPWHVTESEAQTLAFALPRVAAAARLDREQPELWREHTQGDIAFVPASFDPAREELRAEQIEWQPMVPPPESPPENVSLDEATLARVLKLQQVPGFHLEVDVTYSGIVTVAGVDRPRFPKLAMAVDRASGFVGGFHLSDEKDLDGAGSLRTVIEAALTQLGARPATMRVQRPRVAAMLAKITSQLNIPVVRDMELEELNAAKATMESYFSRQ